MLSERPMTTPLVLHFTIGSHETPPNNTRHIMDIYIHHLHTFLHTESGLYNPLQHTHTLSHGPISSTTLYNTLQHSTLYSSTAVLQCNPAG